MLSRRTILLLCVATGVALEIGVFAVSGRREAWDSPLYWTVGLPFAFVAALLIGYMSQRRDWIWSLVIVPSQVLTMVLRSGEIMSGIWPLMVGLSTILSLPFLVVAFVGSCLRPKLTGES